MPLCIIFALYLLAHFQDGHAWKLPKFKSELARVAASSALVIGSLGPMGLPAHAFGPINMDMTVKDYKQVELCNGKKPIMPGQKAMEGLFPVCLEVTADIKNPKAGKALKDVSVYGFVKEAAAGNSVLPNNPDFSTDAGQYAMIKSVEPGDSTITYQFVAAVSTDPKKEEIPKITFFKTKATSYPGGSKFQPLGECEMDPRNCDAVSSPFNTFLAHRTIP